MATTLCPSCGSEHLETTKRNESLPIVYGKPAEWIEIIQHCSICDESGDFSGQNDSQIENAIDAAKKQSVKYMLDSLSEVGITMAYLERALELSPRTIARWKAGKSSASSIALLRIVRTFPWIIDVADAQFDHNFAVKRLIQEAGHVFYEAAKDLNLKLFPDSVMVTSGTGKVSISGSIEFDTPWFDNGSMTPTICWSDNRGIKCD